MIRSGQWEYCFHFQEIQLHSSPCILLKNWKDLEGGGQLGRDHLGQVPLCDPGVATYLPLGILVFSRKVRGVGWCLEVIYLFVPIGRGYLETLCLFGPQFSYLNEDNHSYLMLTSNGKVLSPVPGTQQVFNKW